VRNLTKRLTELERAHAIELRRTRCAHGRAWPGVRAVEIDTEGHETWTDPDAPAVCPRCGWRPPPWSKSWRSRTGDLLAGHVGSAASPW
jgi:hypothetical protein